MHGNDKCVVNKTYYVHYTNSIYVITQPPPRWWSNLIFRLFGLLFAALGVLNLLRPREMTAYQIRQRAGGPIDGQIEPTQTRLLFTRFIGGIMVIIGLGLVTGLLGV